MTEVVRHICWIRASYKVLKRGRKWLHAVSVTPGQKPYGDKILINAISVNWQPGEVRELFAIHVDDITQFGHKVVLIPVADEDYNAAPPASRF